MEPRSVRDASEAEIQALRLQRCFKEYITLL